MSLIERWMSRFTLEQLKMTLLRTAYGNKNTFLSRIDPRVLLIWYSFFTISPWFFYNRTVLVALFAVSLTLALTSRVSGLILFLMAFSTFMNLVYIGVLALFLGGNGEAFLALITLTLKLLIMGLASVAVFTSIDPEKLSDALLAMKVPAPFSFGISYGYRMIPILVEQYKDVFASYRMRGAPRPVKAGCLGESVTISVKYAFSPSILRCSTRPNESEPRSRRWKCGALRIRWSAEMPAG